MQFPRTKCVYYRELIIKKCGNVAMTSYLYMALCGGRHPIQPKFSATDSQR